MSELNSVTTVRACTVEVDLDGRNHRMVWPRHQTLIDAMLQAGLDAPHSCREGHCGSCVATVLSGQVELAASELLTPEDLGTGLILGCQARPVSDHVHIEF